MNQGIIDDRPISRGSKQKIMKLKEELQTKTQGDPQAFRIRQLKESYDLAVLKMNEMNNNQGTNLYVKVHGKKAGKAYSALSSIIYASIAAAKIEGLEVFVKQTVAALPANMIDLEEWNHILTLARECREAAVRASPSTALTNAPMSSDFMKKFQLLYFLSTNPIRNTKDELILFRKTIIDELSMYQHYCYQIMQTVFQVLTRLREFANNDKNMKRIGGLKQEIFELNQVLKQTRASTEESLKQQGIEFQNRYNSFVDSALQEKETMQNNFNQQLDEISQTLNQKDSELQEILQLLESLQKEKDQLLTENNSLQLTNSNLSQSLDIIQKDYQSLSDFTNKQTIDFLTNTSTKQILLESLHNIESLTNEKMKNELRQQIIHLQNNLENVKNHSQEYENRHAKELQDFDMKFQQLEKDYQEKLKAKDSELVDKNQLIDSLSTKTKTLESDFLAAKEILEGKEVSLTSTKNLLEERENEISSLKKSLSTTEEELSATKAKLSLLEGELKGLKSDLSEKDAVLSQSTKTSLSQGEEKDKLNEKMKELTDQNNFLTNSLDEITEKTEKTIVELISSIEEEKKKSSELFEFINSLENQLKENNQQFISYENTIKELSNNNQENVNYLLNEKQLEIDSLKELLEKKNKEMDALLAVELTTSANSAISSSASPEELEKQLNKLRLTIEHLNNDKMDNQQIISQLNQEVMLSKLEINEIKKNEFLIYLSDKLKEFNIYQERHFFDLSSNHPQANFSFKKFHLNESNEKINQYANLFELKRKELEILENEIASSTSNSANENTLLMSPLFMNTLQNWRNQVFKKTDELYSIQLDYEFLLFESLQSHHSTALSKAPSQQQMPVIISDNSSVEFKELKENLTKIEKSLQESENKLKSTEQQLKSVEKERNILKDKFDFLQESKTELDHVIKDLREELSRMTNEYIELKDFQKQTLLSGHSIDSLDTAGDRKRTVGFADSPEVIVFAPMASAPSMVNPVIEDDDKPKAGPPTTQVPAAEQKTTPAAPVSVDKSDEMSVNSQLSTESSKLARNAAYYEAQHVVLEAIKAGVMKVKDSDKPIAMSPRAAVESKEKRSSFSSFSPEKPSNSQDNSVKAAAPAKPVEEEREESQPETKLEPVNASSDHRASPAIEETKEEAQKVAEEILPVAEEKVERALLTENKEDKAEDAKEEKKSKKDKKPFVNPYAHLNMDDPDTKRIVKLQATARSFTARQRVRRINMEKKATSQGILVACYGTNQGETGWYTSQDQLFYFCAQEEEFLLLCGPITKDIYELALEDLVITMTPSLMTPIEQIPSADSPNSDGNHHDHSLSLNLERYKKRPPKFPKNIIIDHLGLQATRIQIETLLHDISLRDHYINEYEIQLNELNSFCNSLQTELQQRDHEILKTNIQNKEYSDNYSVLSYQYSDLLMKMKNYSEKNLLTMKSTIESLIHGTDYELKWKKIFIKLTCIIRGFLGRQRVKKIKQIRLADETGVLVAMKNTIQGQTGWYLGPNGSIFYFVLKDGKWIYTAGPLTQEEYRMTYLSSKNISKSPYQRQFPEGKLLTRCSLRVNGLLHQLSQQIQQQQVLRQQLLMLTTSDTREEMLLLSPDAQPQPNAPAAALPAITEQPEQNPQQQGNQADNASVGSLHTASQLSLSQSQSQSQSNMLPVAALNPVNLSGQVYYYTEIYQLLEQSDIYVSNQNEKLYLSIPLEEFVFTFLNNQQQFGMNESTVNSLFSPESSKILNDYPPMKSPNLSSRGGASNNGNGNNGPTMIMRRGDDVRGDDSSIESK